MPSESVLTTSTSGFWVSRTKPGRIIGSDSFEALSITTNPSFSKCSNHSCSSLILKVNGLNILVVNFILGQDQLECSIDYDNDSIINVLDLVIMINLILNED